MCVDPVRLVGEHGPPLHAWLGAALHPAMVLRLLLAAACQLAWKGHNSEKKKVLLRALH